jgi:hypothetical protein
MDIVTLTMSLLMWASITTIALILIFFFARKWTIFGLKLWLNKRGSVVFRVFKDKTILPSVETITDEIEMPPTKIQGEKVKTRNILVSGVFHRMPSAHNRPVHIAIEGMHKNIDLAERYPPTIDVDNINQAQLMTAQTFLNIGRRMGQGKNYILLIAILAIVAAGMAGLSMYYGWLNNQALASIGGGLQQLGTQIADINRITILR